MSIAALITWILAAGVGLFMLIRWATRGGVRKVEGAGTHFLPARVFTHFGLAAAGLILWIVYLVTDNHLLAWIAAGGGTFIAFHLVGGHIGLLDALALEALLCTACLDCWA